MHGPRGPLEGRLELRCPGDGQVVCRSRPPKHHGWGDVDENVSLRPILLQGSARVRDDQLPDSNLVAAAAANPGSTEQMRPFFSEILGKDRQQRPTATRAPLPLPAEHAARLAPHREPTPVRAKVKVWIGLGEASLFRSRFGSASAVPSAHMTGMRRERHALNLVYRYELSSQREMMIAEIGRSPGEACLRPYHSPK